MNLTDVTSSSFRRRSKTSISALFLLAFGSASSQEISLHPSIRAKDIQTHVDYLASDNLQGRHSSSEEAFIAAEYVARHFEEFGLQPIGTEVDPETYFLNIDDASIAPNVVGTLPGTGPGYVLVTAHYDHLRPKKTGEDRIFNGADDNASGTSGVLEIAHAFAARKKSTLATLVFVAFTAEERGLRGSRYFAEHPPFPLEAVSYTHLTLPTKRIV